jgi:TldD protein
MTRRLLLISLLCAAALAGAGQAPAEDDVVLRAMRDELDRSRTLRLVSLETPYYIEYAVHDSESFAVSASLGALVYVQKTRARLPRLQVRVGDYKFDDGNYIYSNSVFGSRYNLGPFPIDDDYAALRQYFWLATDLAYKSALEIIARKRAAQKNVNVSDQPPDFSKAEATSLVLGNAKRVVEEESWKSRIRSLSSLFASHPQITGSDVTFQIVQGSFSFVNSEGTRVRAPENAVRLHVRARALAPDGISLRDAVSFHAHEIGSLPPELELRREVQNLAENLEALVRAPRGDPYTGPVLFEPAAAAQLLAEVLGRNFALRRRPVSEPGRPLAFVESELEGRLGSRILPEWMDVVDDPTQADYGGRPLFGHYLVDLEGVIPKPLVLVEKGILKNYLMTRQPQRGLEGSNGRARLLGGFGANAAAFGNLLVRTSESSSLPDLKRKLLDLCRQRNMPYGLLVRKMDFPSSASVAEVQQLVARMTADGGSGRPVSVPILAYRVYNDGREELVRGLRFKGLSVRSLRDIVASGGEAAMFDYLENGVLFALMGAGNYVAESSVIAPAVLFEELQLDRTEAELPKLPIVAPPPLTPVR